MNHKFHKGNTRQIKFKWKNDQLNSRIDLIHSFWGSISMAIDSVKSWFGGDRAKSSGVLRWGHFPSNISWHLRTYWGNQWKSLKKLIKTMRHSSLASSLQHSLSSFKGRLCRPSLKGTKALKQARAAERLGFLMWGQKRRRSSRPATCPGAEHED